MGRKCLVAGLLLVILVSSGYVGQFFLVSFLWGQADGAFHRGQYQKVQRCLTVITWLRPSDEEAYLLKGWLQWSQAYELMQKGRPYHQKLEMASCTLKDGQDKNPSSWRLFYEEGIMWEAFHEQTRSLEAYYQMSLRCGPPYSRMYSWKKARLSLKAP
ncbi:MAG TPA: hypothetical protein PKX93_11605 [bacterium]|nr:hypothetical protein [bacterium]HOL68091.1 hypothetical protein [bacterium]HPP13187.1 hypothetical protein [bacterium]